MCTLSETRIKHAHPDNANTSECTSAVPRTCGIIKCAFHWCCDISRKCQSYQHLWENNYKFLDQSQLHECHVEANENPITCKGDKHDRDVCVPRTMSVKYSRTLVSMVSMVALMVIGNIILNIFT